MEKLYVLSGKPRHGKDTVAEILEKIYQEKNKRVIKLSYGFYPKYYAQRIFGWDGREETKPRTELQEIAMKAREKNPNYMVRRVEEDINIIKDYCDVIIITDARMPEEIEMPKKEFEDAITIRVERTNFNSPLTSVQANHIVETSLDDYSNYDYKIINDSTLEILEEKVKKIVEGKE